jgi:hypothetical protein
VTGSLQGGGSSVRSSGSGGGSVEIDGCFSPQPGRSRVKLNNRIKIKDRALLFMGSPPFLGFIELYMG